jgi:hypothetical protein
MYRVPHSYGPNARLPLLPWLLASSAGAAIGGVLTLLLYYILRGDELYVDLSWVLVSTLVCCGQSLVLKVYLGRKRWWIIAGAGGALLYIAFTNIMQGTDRTMNPSLLSLILGSGIGYLFSAVAQWAVLRRFFRRAGWWILVSPLSGILGGMLGALLNTQVAGLEVSSLWAALTIWGVAYGIVWGASGLLSGYFLRWLLKHPVSSEADGALV